MPNTFKHVQHVLLVALGEGDLTYLTNEETEAQGVLPAGSEGWNQNQNLGLLPPRPFLYSTIPSSSEIHFHRIPSLASPL